MPISSVSVKDQDGVVWIKILRDLHGAETHVGPSFGHYDVTSS